MKKCGAQKQIGSKLATAILEQEFAITNGRNIAVSPLGIATSLALLANGCRGSSKKALLEFLGQPHGASKKLRNENFAFLRKSIFESADLDLHFAATMVAANKIKIKDHFKQKAALYFDTSIHAIDFSDPAASILLDSLICQKTKGRIASIAAADCQKFEPENMLVLLNAVYCKGNWQHGLGFNHLLTQWEDFHCSDGRVLPCALMSQKASFYCAQTKDYQAVKLPYANSGRFSLLLVLPTLQNSSKSTSASQIGELLQTLSSSAFEHFASTAGFCRQIARVFLPRFETDHSCNLNASLAKLGLTELFQDGSADLRSIFDSAADSFCPLSFEQRAVFLCREDAKSSIPGSSDLTERAGKIDLKEDFVFRADRPFLYFVLDECTGSILLNGLLQYPELL